MILYKTNDNWFGDMRHLFTSWTMTRIVRSVVGIGIYAGLFVWAVQYFEVGELLMMDTTVFSLLGVILSLFLGFRTTTALSSLKLAQSAASFSSLLRCLNPHLATAKLRFKRLVS